MPQIHEPGNKDNDTKILPVDSDVQEMVNTPPVDPDGFTKEEEDFLRMIMMMISDNRLNPLQPSSLINQVIYEQASQEAQGKADLTSISFCARIRDIQNLYEFSGGEALYVKPTYQIKNLVMDLKYRKEQFENKYGDMFLI
ncbi:hypothetical protein CL656_00320 [bacterium]|nr:hypothetical protein [bacterium]|tara:strand:- start:4318 stop:4740 length:423 start_codon:yes stop_codon:yes gene_type:complete